MCSLDPGTCQLFVYNATSGICYFGQIAASTSGITVNTALSSTVYTRMRKKINHIYISAFDDIFSKEELDQVLQFNN